MKTEFKNPFRPGAGHMPPYLAGRGDEKQEFERLLAQDTILENLILTGLRGVGKTVLLETFKPFAIDAGWLWVGTDLSESSSITETSLAIRLLTDLSVVTSTVVTRVDTTRSTGFTRETYEVRRTLDYAALASIYEGTPGLVSDKLKGVLEAAWMHLKRTGKRGVVFAYDEAQNMADHSQKDEFPLSLLLDVFQSIQRKGVPFMLALTGLPTLLPKLVEARTYSERMFHQLFLDKLSREDTEAAMLKPIAEADCPVKFRPESVAAIYSITRGYPYFVQYVCREVFDVWTQQSEIDGEFQPIPVQEITRKLDTDFFAGRWARATDRQRDLLWAISQLPNSESEFTVQEVVEQSKSSARPFSGSHVNQMLSSLSDAGLIYKNRWGKYSFAVPLLDQFIRRQGASRPLL